MQRPLSKVSSFLQLRSNSFKKGPFIPPVNLRSKFSCFHFLQTWILLWFCDWGRIRKGVLFVFWRKWEQVNLLLRFTDLYTSTNMPFKIKETQGTLEYLWHPLIFMPVLDLVESCQSRRHRRTSRETLSLGHRKIWKSNWE